MYLLLWYERILGIWVIQLKGCCGFLMKVWFSGDGEIPSFYICYFFYYSSHFKLSDVFFGIPEFSICQVFESVLLHYESVGECSRNIEVVSLSISDYSHLG